MRSTACYEFLWHFTTGGDDHSGRSDRAVRRLLSECRHLSDPTRALGGHTTVLLSHVRPTAAVVGERAGGVVDRASRPLPHLPPTYLGSLSPRGVDHRG